MLNFLIICLATWRLTSLLVADREAGPFDILHRLRDAIGLSYDNKSKCTGNVIAKALCCFWCLSLWISLLICTPLFWGPELPIYVLAASGAAIGMDKFINE